MNATRRPTQAQQRLLCSILYGWHLRRGFRGRHFEATLAAVIRHGWVELLEPDIPASACITVSGRKAIGAAA
jgi:hypothetical protein